jgi:hypothetical protein
LAEEAEEVLAGGMRLEHCEEEVEAGQVEHLF